MKKGWLGLLLILLIGLVFTTVGVLSAVEIPDKIVIESKGYKKVTKAPVPFNHKEHATEYGIACTECHHNYKDGKNVWKEGDPVQECSACHDPEKTVGKVKKLQNAFHTNCRDCHKKVDEEGKNAPYKKCTDCHQK